MHYTEQNSNGFSWRECGKGDVIVFLHAMAGSRAAWDPQLDQLSNQYRCVAWDMPGYGDSEALSCAAGMPEVLSCLAEFVRTCLNVDRAHFAGLSVGGIILQKFAVQSPDLIRSISILDSAPKFGYGGTMQPNEFAEPVLAALRSGKSIPSFSEEMVREVVGPDTSEVVILEAIGAMCLARREGLELATRLIAGNDDMSELSKIAVPVMVMVGEQDAETPFEYSRAIAEAIPASHLSIVQNAGHLSNLENPAQVNQFLADFLATVNR